MSKTTFVDLADVICVGCGDEMRLRQLSAARGQVTRIKNRVGNGVCPCCNRSFGNLHRHMQTKHPGWKKPEGGDA